ncbi:MAG: general secretion pathway protein GspK [Deltaproteobacteria bacterium]|nr:general secretion pathway protein GspK [Deltaproteobacteria bacterium]MBI2501258.1 general secretion pathway protein GspK [Deltaproteobacteria bacterium]
MINKLFKNESGVALMLVLSSLLLVSTVAVEFAYNVHIAYEVAATQRDRLKAEYLAQSAVNLVRWELAAERKFKQRFSSLLQQLSGGSFTQEPFCKAFPLASGMIEGIGLSGASGEGEMKKEEGEENQGEDKGKPDEPEERPSEDLLDLGGDFEGSCDTEESRINLNAFRSSAVPNAQTPPREEEEETGGRRPQNPKNPATPSPMVSAAVLYEEQKNLLVSLLSQKSLEPLFEGKTDEIKKLVTRIGDWVDADDRINEAQGVQGGYEESEYKEVNYKPKNGKFASRAELLLIPGLGDEIYQKIESSLTVYGDGKINICQANDQTILTFLLFMSMTPGAPRFNLEDEKKNEAILETVRKGCAEPNPQPNQLAQMIAANTGGDSRVLSSRISTQNRFYTLKGVGVAGDAEVTIHTVIDTDSSNPNLWKILYFRVE